MSIRRLKRPHNADSCAWSWRLTQLWNSTASSGVYTHWMHRDAALSSSMCVVRRRHHRRNDRQPDLLKWSLQCSDPNALCPNDSPMQGCIVTGVSGQSYISSGKNKHRRRRREAGRARPPPQKKIEKYFSGNYYVKFGNFDNFSYIFSGKNVVPLKLTELLRLWEQEQKCVAVGPGKRDNIGVDCRDILR